jgi:asparagine synthase (glutamine-hydrolysing)
MTAIAACTGAAAARGGQITRMLDAAAHRGPHASTWISDRAQLGVRGRNDVAVAELHGNAAVLTGRIDNRDEIAGACGAPRGSDGAALLLHAYARWGEDAPAHLVGDFACALWDAEAARLVCARDALGQRPLFYADTAGGAIVASEPQQLLAHPSCRPSVNDGVVAEFLTGGQVTARETVWRGITRVLAGELIVCADGGVRARRYWDFDASRRLDCRTDAEYDEQFRALLDEAIACRTRGEAAVGVFLSGGLDSSAVAGVAAARRAAGGPALAAYSLTFPGEAADERAFIDAVVERWSLPSTRLPARAPVREEIAAEIDRYRDLPMYPNGAILNPLRARAARDVRVVLTGYGGDDWFTGSPLHTTDLLRQGRVLPAWRQLRADAALPGRGYSVTGLLRTTLTPLLPVVVRRALRPFAGRRLVFPWIRAGFAAQVSLEDRLRQRPPASPGTRVQQEIRSLLFSLAQTQGDEMEERAAAAAGIDQRHPFTDRRLAEFGFALPEPQRWSGGETKVVMRRALEAVLPPLVRHRNDKAEFTSSLVHTIEGLGGGAFLRDVRIARAGWVDAAALQQTYREMRGLYTRGDEAYIPLADGLWSVAAVELWFEQCVEGVVL